MRIQHNIMAMNAYRNYSNNTSALSKNLEKLSSGYKINRAGDDAAGLAISEKMRAQITGLDVAQKNAKDGISLVQTAEGALTEVHDMLNRMVELADQSANGTYDGTDRNQLQKEVTELKKEINRIADSSNFNGINLLDGSMSDVQTTTFKADAGTNKAASDFSVGIGKWTKNDGTTAAITVEVTHGAGGNKAEIANDGSKVTITVDTTKDVTAEDLQVLLKGATVATGGTLTDDEKNSLLEAVHNASVRGKGITGLTGSTALNATASTSGGTGKPLTLQIGDTSDDFNQLNVSINDCHATSLGIDGIDISTQEGAKAAVDVIKSAINYVSDVRGALGATQNRLDHTINNLSVMEENIQDAESTIRDTDVADEMMAYTKNNILIQSAQAMLAQANQVPQGVLQLLQ